MLSHPFDPEWDTDKGWKSKATAEEIMDVLDGPEQECIPITAEIIKTIDLSRRPHLFPNENWGS